MIAYPAKVAGIKTRLLEAGRGHDTVIFLHGIGARADRWRYNLDPVAHAGYHAFALDFPGHGFAEKGTDFDHSVPNLASFVRAFLDERRLEKTILIGTSLGGHVAAWLASQHPERVRALILVGALGLQALPPDSRDRMARSLLRTDRDAVRSKLERLLFDHSLITDEWIEEECAINTSPGAQHDFARLSLYVQREDGLDADACGPILAKPARRVPVLLLWGAADLSIPPSIGQAAHAALPGSQLVIMENCGHLPYLERPDQFNALTIKFCNEVRTSGTARSKA